MISYLKSGTITYHNLSKLVIRYHKRVAVYTQKYFFPFFSFVSFILLSLFSSLFLGFFYFLYLSIFSIHSEQVGRGPFPSRLPK